MAVSDAHVFPGFLTPVLTQLFFPKPLTTSLCRGEGRKYAGKKGDQTHNHQVISPTRSPERCAGRCEQSGVRMDLNLQITI